MNAVQCSPPNIRLTNTHSINYPQELTRFTAGLLRPQADSQIGMFPMTPPPYEIRRRREHLETFLYASNHKKIDMLCSVFKKKSKQSRSALNNMYSILSHKIHFRLVLSIQNQICVKPRLRFPQWKPLM